MISTETIYTLHTKYQTSELNIRREYVQHLFLSYFYQQPQTEAVYFKGGTALRIAYNSPRFSEDLDFSASLYDIHFLEEAVLLTLRDIEREGIHSEIIESKKTTRGYLAIIVFHLGDERVAIQLEVSLRQGDKRGEVVTIVGDFLPPYTIESLVREQLVGEKIQALLTRKKPRDFYDLYYMLRANMLTPQEKDMLPKALEALNTTAINFEQELKQFLPKAQWAVIRDFKISLEREIQRFL